MKHERDMRRELRKHIACGVSPERKRCRMVEGSDRLVWNEFACAPSGSKTYLSEDGLKAVCYDEDAFHAIGAGWFWMVFGEPYEGEEDMIIVSPPDDAVRSDKRYDSFFEAEAHLLEHLGYEI